VRRQDLRDTASIPSRRPWLAGLKGRARVGLQAHSGGGALRATMNFGSPRFVAPAGRAMGEKREADLARRSRAHRQLAGLSNSATT